MKRDRSLAHLVHRLGGDDVMAQRGKACRIATGAGADIEHTTGRRRYQPQRHGLRLGERDAFVGLEKLGRFLRIALGAAQARHHSIGPSASRVVLPSTTGTTSNSTTSCQSAIQRWNSVTSSASMIWKQRPRSAET